MTAIEQAQEAFNDGMMSSDNPYCIDTSEWCQWAKEFGRLNDEYMDLATSDES